MDNAKSERSCKLWALEWLMMTPQCGFIHCKRYTSFATDGRMVDRLVGEWEALRERACASECWGGGAGASEQ
ncbi:unnamed protein product [Soboliphyme baturini]|uniref:Uncharacterized protein n=1 Tax=Soboliphyme baturini TaxID=241478 RepID=A0A183IAM4_9BILA|nr:unnamed protein product [Soboliphyme baturini]